MSDFTIICLIFAGVVGIYRLVRFVNYKKKNKGSRHN